MPVCRFMEESKLPTCTICLCPFDSSNPPFRLKDCGHIGHSDCLKNWFAKQATCPTCRAPANESSLQKDFILTDLLSSLSALTTNSPIKPSSNWTSPLHEHALEKISGNVRWICDWCANDYQGTALRYHCSTCGDWDLCEKCFGGDPPHSHPLKHTSHTGVVQWWSCNKCSRALPTSKNPSSYRCTSCNFDLCSRCLKQPIHSHPLSKILNSLEIYPKYEGKWVCNVCNVLFSAEHPMYHCTVCSDWDCCSRCNFQQRVHLHKLKKTTSILVGYKSTWVCDICSRKSSNAHEEFYHCDTCTNWDCCSTCARSIE